MRIFVGLVAAIGLAASAALGGGLSLEFTVRNQWKQAPEDERERSFETTLDLIRARLSTLKHWHPTVRGESNGRFFIDIPEPLPGDVESVQRAVTMIGKLQFALDADGEVGLDLDELVRRRDDYIAKLPAEMRTRSADLDRLTKDCATDWSTFRWRPMSERGARRESQDAGSVEWVLVQFDRRFEITGKDVEKVYGVDADGYPGVGVQLDAKAADVMGDFTERHVGRSMVVLLDDEVEMRARITGKCRDQIAISGAAGGFTLETALELIAVLSSGPLPFKPAYVGKRSL
jgi:preprotein translocase subunit SecD